MLKQRTRAKRAARTIRSHPRVAAVNVLAPDTDPTGDWTLEITLTNAIAAPPAALHTLAVERLSIRDARSQGPAFRVVASA